MTKLATFAIALILVAGVVSTAAATTIYFDDGTFYDLQENEAVYVSSGRVWELTRFNTLDLQLESLAPLEVEEPEEDCLGFGYSTCASGVFIDQSESNTTNTDQ
jgi:hypothetical protein